MSTKSIPSLYDNLFCLHTSRFHCTTKQVSQIFQKRFCFNYFIDNVDFFQLPVNLLRAGRIFTFEPPPGVKANLIRTFNTIPASRMMKAPNERARLYLLLAWFHAIVQERLRYCPLGKSETSQ